MTEADIEIIIVTAFITSIITGIITNFIFLRYQKRVESSYAKQLDEFRAKLQQSNLTYQTKFSATYDKRVKVLEELFRCISEYAENYQSFFMRIQHRDFPNDADANLYRSCESQLREFWRIFYENRLFLSVDQFIELGDIHVEILTIQGLTYYTFPSFRSTYEFEDIDKKLLIERGVNVNLKEWGKDDLLKFSVVLESLLFDQIRRLEQLYSSIAEPANE